jgi:hypothetical protein
VCDFGNFKTLNLEKSGYDISYGYLPGIQLVEENTFTKPLNEFCISNEIPFVSSEFRTKLLKCKYEEVQLEVCERRDVKIFEAEYSY